jgi:DNA-binding SARP family transcriptional activator
MMGYLQAGQPAAALRQYETCVRLLDDELGVPPEAETVALAETIRSRRGLDKERGDTRQETGDTKQETGGEGETKKRQ